MSVQDKVERVLREIHILISKSEPYGDSPDKVIISKTQALELLNQLTYCMADMMEEYEATARSRDKKERDAKRKGEDIIRNANHAAEDIYAASVLYSDEALRRIQSIIQDAGDEMERVFRNVKDEMNERQKVVRENQSELKASLAELKDTEKYLRMMEDRNRELQKSKDKKNNRKEKTVLEIPSFPTSKPEIKINPEYFEKTGRPMEVLQEEEAQPKTVQSPEIKVNLDAEYFRWRQQQQKRKAD